MWDTGFRCVVEPDSGAARVKSANAGATATTGAVVATSGAKAKLSGLVRSYTNTLGMKFVPVPGTKVLFCIHETRRMDYAAYAVAEPGVRADWKRPMRNEARVGTGSDDEPVVEVSWQDAVDFCAWLSKSEGHTYRLPTDREWSFAAGIGDEESPQESPESLNNKIKGKFPWGNALPPPKGAGNILDESFKEKVPGMNPVKGYNDGFPTLAPVMSFKPNSLGIYDLAGNVWEWCADWGDATQKGRVVRGGSWVTGLVLSSRRMAPFPSVRIWDYGFRCVVEPDVDTAPVQPVSADAANAPATASIPPAVATSTGARTKLSGLARSFTNTLGMKFVPVPGTNVLFCIHETRKRDYAVYAAGNAGVDDGWKNPVREGVPVGEGQDDPVVMVSWEDAEAFCAWLGKQEKHSYRLATDREWSIALGIADRESPDATPESLNDKLKDENPWGRAWPPPKGAANIQDETCAAKFKSKAFARGYTDGFATTAPVMSFKPNKLGIYDLVGNVWQWCEDWSNEAKTLRVARAGSWATTHPTSSRRNGQSPRARTFDIGFRCVVEPDK